LCLPSGASHHRLPARDLFGKSQYHGRMTETRPLAAVEVIEANLAAYNARDIDGFMRWFADEVEVMDQKAGAVVMRGLGEVRRFYAVLFETSPALRSHVLQRVAVGGSSSITSASTAAPGATWRSSSRTTCATAGSSASGSCESRWLTRCSSGARPYTIPALSSPSASRRTASTSRCSGPRRGSGTIWRETTQERAMERMETSCLPHYAITRPRPHDV
jgi:hypothetical protein